MSDRPIIFSAPMVRALLDGRKTQTRRVLKPPYGMLEFRPNGSWRPICTKFFQGDRLYVREAFRGSKGYDAIPPAKWGNKPIWYDADGEPDAKVWWHLSDRSHPSIHMPRWASRLTLTVTEVRVQRLQEISGEDVAAEGACEFALWPPTDEDAAEARQVFRDLWDSLHGPDAWDANPWVVAVSFTVLRANIDGITDHSNLI